MNRSKPLIAERLISVCESDPSKLAIKYERDSFTFEQLLTRVCQLVNALHNLGARKGDRVAILSQNCHQYRELFWAVALGNFMIVPVNYRLSPREIAYILNDSEAKILLVSDEYSSLIESIKNRLTSTKHFIGIQTAAAGLRDYEELISSASSAPPPSLPAADDLIWLLYTSGTTGLPKGAMHTHRSVTALVDLAVSNFAIDEATRSLVVTPFYALSGGGWDSICSCMGSTTVILRNFNPVEVLETIQNERITDVHLVPAMINFIVNCPDFDQFDLSSLQRITYGASPMPPQLMRKAMEKIGPIFIQDFGCAEGGLMTLLPETEHVLEGPEERTRRLTSCGKGLPELDVRVLNEQGQDVKPGEVGELTVKGDTVMAGYWKMPEATAQVLRDGRLHTGDLATVDSEGWIYIVDRKKDMIISGGANIYPREVEDVLFAHPAVLEAAVIGVPDEKWGENVKALVVLKPAMQCSEEELINHCKANLASYKKPKSIEFVDSLPRNPSGKVLKRVLREKYWAGQDRQVY
ncbi:MAG: long-chain-fatty-acid--CoA ligase [Candidatus Abyssobacteria bacterium SURF_5]|uniref:Long-chain-fatty-acid--CoA ligase n=1 Tax=Abyssobacteria bacterium (strain SURF_5) TaxID=2093360 RepID=A0A3A4PBN4_ABYX5|nr:MAG: long-chain-fatty-acid--CoA ligase [Candidatus Abyssubacteria bacterium SURF_5]